MIKMHGTSFGWQEWRGGSIIDLGIPCCRKEFILDKANILRQYAVGWCPIGETLCRQKQYIAIMFQKNDVFFWNHLLIEEVQAIWPEIFAEVQQCAG